MKQIKRLFSTEIFLIKSGFRADWKASAIYILLTFVQHAIPLLSIWLWKVILDGFILIYNTHSLSYTIIWWYLGIYLILQLLAAILRGYSDVLFHKVKNDCKFELRTLNLIKLLLYKLNTLFVCMQVF